MLTPRVVCSVAFITLALYSDAVYKVAAKQVAIYHVTDFPWHFLEWEETLATSLNAFEY